MNYWAQTKPDPLTLEFNEGVESGGSQLNAILDMYDACVYMKHFFVLLLPFTNKT
jgi:hypothetical protein